MRAPGLTLPMAVAAASDAVAWADGNESWLGALASGGRRRSRGRSRRTATFTRKLSPTAAGATGAVRSGERECDPDRSPLAGRPQALQCLLGGPWVAARAH